MKKILLTSTLALSLICMSFIKTEDDNAVITAPDGQTFVVNANQLAIALETEDDKPLPVLGTEGGPTHSSTIVCPGTGSKCGKVEITDKFGTRTVMAYYDKSGPMTMTKEIAGEGPNEVTIHVK